MSYDLKNVFSSDTREFGRTYAGIFASSPTEMAYDGRYIWVTCGEDGIAIYDHWREDINRTVTPRPTFPEIDELNFPGYHQADVELSFEAIPQRKLKLVTFLKIAPTYIIRTTTLESIAEPGSEPWARAGAYDVVEEIYNIKRDQYGDSTYVDSYVRNDSNSEDFSAHYIQRIGNMMYVTNGAQFSEILEFNIDTQKYVRTITVTDDYIGPESTVAREGNPIYFPNDKYPMLSNMAASNGKLWMVGRAWSDYYTRKVYSFDPRTNIKQSTYLPQRQSGKREYIASGLNGYVYVTNYNNWSITKIDDKTGAIVKTIRVNGYPQGIWASPDRRIFVTSYAGMLSLIDWDDDGVHNDYSTEAVATQFQIDPTDSASAWFIKDQKLAKYNLNTKKMLETGTTNDWEFTHPQLNKPDNFLIIPGFTYQNENLQNVIVKPQIVVSAKDKQDKSVLLTWKIGFPNSPDEADMQADITYFDYKYPYLDYPYRTVFFEMSGQAAVTAGDYDYFGE